MENYVTFFTATILEWKPLLLKDYYKDVIISSLRFLKKDNRADIYAFVIMPNHIHLIWKMKNDRKYEDVQRDFMKYTRQQLKSLLERENPEELKQYYVAAKDRQYQIWERDPLSSRLPSEELILQKLNYIHANPISGKWKLCDEFTDYKYSSAGHYYGLDNDWDFLTHYAQAEF